MNPSGATTSNAWKKSGAKTSTKPATTDGRLLRTHEHPMIRYFLSLMILGALVPSTRADLKVLPPAVTLTGPHAAQRLLVVNETAGKVTADLTGHAKLTSSNPAVAAVDADGVVRAVADGEATITATHGKQQSNIKVQVVKTK